MLQALKDNIPWIFSGVGIPVVAWIIWLLRKRLLTPTPPSPQAAISALAPPVDPRPLSTTLPESVPQKKDRLSPLHMLETVSSAAPLAREHVKQQFIGLSVEWSLPFSDALRQGNTDVATVYLSVPSSSYEVRCEVSIERFPFLRVAARDDMMQISGVVSDVSSVEVILRDVVLSR